VRERELGSGSWAAGAALIDPSSVHLFLQRIGKAVVVANGQQFEDLLDGFAQCDLRVIVPSLIKHFSFEGDQVVFAGTQQITHTLVRNDVVHSEEIAESDGSPSIVQPIAAVVNDFAKSAPFLPHVLIGLLTSQLCHGTSHRSAVIRIIDIQFCECVSIGTVDVGEGIG